MADIKQLENNPETQLWEHLKDAKYVMLGSPEPNQHMQPMAPQIDDEDGAIWFFANVSSDLVKAVNARPGDVHMCVTESDYQACLRGSIGEEKSDAKIEQFWSPVVAAWFEGGQSDPDLTLLKFQPKDAAVWASSRNPITFAWEIAKANMKDRTPDVGARGNVNFREGEA
ncbi:MAG: pyridoxamine 5'-phosphate oxidase family protein [Pseudomonadota bacterium]